MKDKILIILVALALALMSGSCHSSRNAVRGGAVATGNDKGSVDATMAQSLVDCARGWIGTPYRYGGNDRRGVDCSGLTTNVFSKAAGVKLPRDSRSQKDYCRKIDRKALQPGDLVFFVGSKGSRRVNHVGLYIGRGEMIHASSSRGVIVSDITSGYWDKHYYASGRVDAVTYRWLGTKPGVSGKDNKGDNKSKKNKKDKKADKNTTRQPRTAERIAPSRQPAVRPVPAAEIHFPSEPLPSTRPAAPVSVPPVPAPAQAPAEPVPAPEAPAMPAQEPDSTQSAWFD